MSQPSGKQSDYSLSLRDVMNRLFEESFLPSGWTSLLARTGVIPVDMYQDDGNLVVKAFVPQVKSEDLNVEVKDDVLTISGETKQEQEHKEQDYFLREHRYGHIERSVPLPYQVQEDKAHAEFENGMLTVTMPKAETAKGSKISVKSK